MPNALKSFLIRLLICAVLYAFAEALLPERGANKDTGAIRTISIILFAAALGI